MTDSNDELCFCFHITRQKIVAMFNRNPHVQVDQIKERLGIGTACGCCLRRLERVLSDLRTNSCKQPTVPQLS